MIRQVHSSRHEPLAEASACRSADFPVGLRPAWARCPRRVLLLAPKTPSVRHRAGRSAIRLEAGGPSAGALTFQSACARCNQVLAVSLDCSPPVWLRCRSWSVDALHPDVVSIRIPHCDCDEKLMNLQDSEAFRQQLLSQQAELEALGETARAATQTVDLDQSSVGRLSRMDAMQGQQMALESARRREQELRAIQGALRRIDAGEFGQCSVCGEEISLKRLHADPKVTRCIGCADT